MTSDLSAISERRTYVQMDASSLKKIRIMDVIKAFDLRLKKSNSEFGAPCMNDNIFRLNMQFPLFFRHLYILFSEIFTPSLSTFVTTVA